MKKAGLFLILVTMLGCSQKKAFHLQNVKNPEFRKNTAFSSYENVLLPKFKALREKYQLDTIFHGETDEFKRILLLRNWIRSVVSINDFAENYPGAGNPESILDAALKGVGFHCEHYMIVQNAVMNAYGYYTRCLGAGPGVKGGPDGHHGMNEIWLNQYQKWFLSDAKYNHHFEKNGIPLSALEVRDEYLKNQVADVVLVKGPGRTSILLDSVADKKGEYKRRTKQQFAQVYTWLEWDMYNDRYSSWPDFDDRLIMYRDEYFKTHTWIWDGKPHWAYSSGNVKYVDAREAMEWTPNTISGNVTISSDTAAIALNSVTPNFKEYQLKSPPDENWIRCDSVITRVLNQDTVQLTFRTLNFLNVPGPEYKVLLTSKN